MPYVADRRARGRLTLSSIVVAAALTVGACGERGAASGNDSAASSALASTSTLAADEQAALRRLPAGAGRDLVAGNCLVCHGSMMIEQQHKDSAAWNKTISTMVAWGAPLPPAQQPVLVAYLTEHFPARADVAAPARTAP